MLHRRSFLAGMFAAASLLRLPRAWGAKRAPVVTKEPGYTRYFTPKMVVSVPDALNTHLASAQVDWVLHFHGAIDNLEKNLLASGVSAVISVVNRGASAEVYGRLTDPLSKYEDETRTILGGTLSVKRTGLIGWSAGGSAVHRLIMDEPTFNRVDSIILADGLYSSYRSATDHGVNRAPLEEYARFAKLAKAKTKFFGLTHGTIVEVGHPTVRESIDELLAMVGDTTKPWGAAPPSYALRPYRELHAGEFHVLGYKGDTRDAHISQLRHMARTVLPAWAARWRP